MAQRSRIPSFSCLEGYSAIWLQCMEDNVRRQTEPNKASGIGLDLCGGLDSQWPFLLQIQCCCLLVLFPLPRHFFLKAYGTSIVYSLSLGSSLVFHCFAILFVLLLISLLLVLFILLISLFFY